MILHAGYWNRNEIVTSEEFGLAGLAVIKHFERHEDLQIFVMREDLNWIA